MTDITRLNNNLEEMNQHLYDIKRFLWKIQGVMAAKDGYNEEAWFEDKEDWKETR